MVPPPVVPARLVVTVSDTVRAVGGGVSFSAELRDSAGTPVAGGGALVWSVSDTGRARITGLGQVTTGPDTGVVVLRARSVFPALADSATLRVVAPGTVRWTFAAADVGGTMPLLGGVALALDGTVYALVEITYSPTFTAALVALTPDGQLKWTVGLTQISANYPVVVPGSGNVLVVGRRLWLISPAGAVLWDTLLQSEMPDFLAGAATATQLIAAQGKQVALYRASDHQLLWQSGYAPLTSWLVPPTAVGAEVVYAKLTDDTLYAFRQSDGAVLNAYADPDTGVDKRVFGAGTVPAGPRFYLPTWSRIAAVDTAGPLRWLTEERGTGVPEPAVGPDGTLYIQSRRFGLETLNRDGSTKWYRRRYINPIGWAEEQAASWYGGAALAQGGIVYGAGQATFFAYDAQGTLRWEFVADSADSFQPFLGAPAIAPDGTVYTFTRTHVYAFYASAPAEPNSRWPMWRHDAQRTGWVR